MIESSRKSLFRDTSVWIDLFDGTSLQNLLWRVIIGGKNQEVTKQLINTIDNAFDLKRIEKLARKAVVDTLRRFKGLERMAIVLVIDGDEYQPRKLA